VATTDVVMLPAKISSTIVANFLLLQRALILVMLYHPRVWTMSLAYSHEVFWRKWKFSQFQKS
jgi:hypothetical protein